MKKFITFALSIACILLSAPSGAALNKANTQRIIRLEGGLNFPATEYDIFPTSGGGNIVIALRLNFNKTLYLEPGVGFGGFYQKISGEYNKLHRIIYDGNMTYFGATIPVYLGAHLFQTSKCNMSLYTGPRLYLGSTSQAKGDITYPSDNTVFSFKKKTFSPGLELCWGVGCEFEFKKFQIRAEYGRGLTEICHFWLTGILDKIVMKRQGVSLSVGYSF